MNISFKLYISDHQISSIEMYGVIIGFGITTKGSKLDIQSINIAGNIGVNK